MIVGGMHIGENTRSAQKSYIREAQAGHRQVLFAIEQSSRKDIKPSSESIIFTAEDARWIIFPHNDLLVVSALIGYKNIHRILLDNGSAVDILYRKAFNRMGLEKYYRLCNTFLIKSL